MKIRYLSENDINSHGLLDIDESLSVMEKMFECIKQNDYKMGGINGNSHGNRMFFDYNEKKNLYISMPGYLGGEFNNVGIKWHGPNIRGILGGETKHMLILNDVNSGYPKGVISATTLTTYRTAAVSLYAVKKLKKKNIECVGIVGPGNINTIFLKGLVNLLGEIPKIKVKGRSVKGLNTFEEKLMNQGIPIERVDTLEECVSESDIISVATGFEFDTISDMPIIRDKWIKKNALILCPSYIKFSDEMIVSRSYNTVDNMKMYMSYKDELGYPVYKSLSNLGNRYVDLITDEKLKLTDVHNIFEINSENVPDDKTLLFCSGGMVVEDIALGTMVLNKAENNNVGTLLEF